MILIVLLYFFTSGSGAEDDDNVIGNKADSTVVKKPINPAGTYLLYNLVKKYSKTKSIRTIQTTSEQYLHSVLPFKHDNGYPNLYVSLAESYKIKKIDYEHLLDFVSAGNYAMISAEEYSNGFMNKLIEEKFVTTSYFFDTVTHVHFNHPDFKSQKDLTLFAEELNYHGKHKYRDFGFFRDDIITEEMIKISGTDNHINCLMVPYGDGFFIVHTQPYNFSNLNVVSVDGKTNAENIFSHFPYVNVYWHQNFGKYSEYRGVPRPKAKKKPQQFSRSSPLEFIVSNPMLFMAFILIIIGLVLYVVVFSKRQQRTIPPVESNDNSSLEFLDIVSKLYYQQKQHNKLVNHMLNIFVSFVRERYYINLTTKQPDLPKRLSEKSGIEEGKIKEIIERFRSAKAKKFSEQELIDLYVQLEYFYQHCN
ncbi:hypothetical protein CRYO30217_02891 [Parvicella tangerina]|uniref:DUF4350 domain-containing protein n=1 Tax=Parvicella tangerina TaxID=2829795 RepID=A0A916JPJ2_9FLAO|nr:hypothetical protein CRYO30217_02891 [Parvicella tangerina]